MKDRLLVTGAVFIIAGGLTAKIIQIIKDRRENDKLIRVENNSYNEESD